MWMAKLYADYTIGTYRTFLYVFVANYGMVCSLFGTRTLVELQGARTDVFVKSQTFGAAVHSAALLFFFLVQECQNLRATKVCHPAKQMVSTSCGKFGQTHKL